jgi:hypothetical protein
VFADNSGHIYAAGSSALDYAVVKYGPVPTGINPSQMITGQVCFDAKLSQSF